MDITELGHTANAIAGRPSGCRNWRREVLRLAAARGASQAEVSISEDTGLAVNVRMGEVETVERTRDRGVAVTVYFGQRKASASTADLQPGEPGGDGGAGLRDREVHRGRPRRRPRRCRR